MELGPWLFGADEGRREDNSVESNVVLAHELVQLDILLVLPPLFPLVGVSSRDRKVADGSIEPDIEDLMLEFFDGNGRAPLQIASDAPTVESLL